MIETVLIVAAVAFLTYRACRRGAIILASTIVWAWGLWQRARNRMTVEDELRRARSRGRTSWR